MPYTYDPSEPNDQFPWYARLLGWIMDKIFGTSEGDNVNPNSERDE